MFNIIPQPVSVLFNSDKKGFTLHAGTTISPFSCADDLISFARKVFNKKVIIHEDTGEEKSIILKLDDSIEQDEGYTILCENRRVYINAKTETGLFYGIQTLKQMLLQTNGKIPYTEIVDYPRFSYRGFNLNCRKNFYTTGEIKRIADLMALHKLNVLRFQDFDNHYTQEETAEIVAYCQTQKIRVITDCETNESNLINSSESPYRLDFPYGFNTLKKVCEDDGALIDDVETYGIEAQVWTENVSNMKRFEFLVFPRLAAMAENAWAEEGYPSFTTFLHKSNDYYKLLDVYKVNGAPVKKACPSLVYKRASLLWFRCKRLIKH